MQFLDNKGVKSLRLNVVVIAGCIIRWGFTAAFCAHKKWKEYPMTEVLSRSKATEWIRALSGGSLSAFIVGVTLLLLTVNQSLSSGIIFLLHVALDLPGILLHTWLFGDPFARLLPPAEALAIGWRIILLALVYWFLSGFALTYFIKNNRKAVMVWLLTILILAILVILLGY